MKTSLDYTNKTVQKQVKKRNFSGFLNILLTMEAVFMVIFLQSQVSSIMIKIGLFLLIGVLQYRLVITIHELSHSSFFTLNGVNKGLGIFLSSLLIINFNYYQKSHRHHHRSKSSDDDPDSYIYKPILQVKKGLPRMLVFIFGSITEILEKIRIKSILSRDNQPKNIKKRYYHLIYILLAQLLIWSYFLYLQVPLGYIIFWIFPLATVVLMLNRTRVIIEHTLTSSKDNTYNLLPAANIASIFIERLIISPYHFNYHLEHHRQPNLYYKELPAFFRLRNKNEIFKTTYLNLLLKILFTLK